MTSCWPTTRPPPSITNLNAAPKGACARNREPHGKEQHRRLRRQRQKQRPVFQTRGSRHGHGSDTPSV
ncbi:hypothetical protein G6F65_023046 [Rhizopus arrhizus]|nr:hypothetical protein G6F31_021901 [Rhizopus arrhizus]KAG1242388.1 hypothetical protein G6F65_023046 [Rhizopus arrhizus]KAG1362891.1 hypothetical protein G6F59_019011 [Rhizopus arrhizus]